MDFGTSMVGLDAPIGKSFPGQGEKPGKCRTEGGVPVGPARVDPSIMTLHVLDTMARLGFEEVHCLHDRRSGLQGFMAIHDTSGGPAFGGVRRMEYRDEEEALMDCLRLSQAMSCLLYTSPSPRDRTRARMPSSA